MAQYLYLDTETYSSADLSKCGAARYAESPDTEVLLVGYAYNAAPAKVWDCTAEPKMPADLRAALDAVLQADDGFIVMHNGMGFDRRVFSACGIVDIPPAKVIDTMVLAYEHSLPGALAALCDVFRLDAAHTKDKEGSDLIHLFCKPLPSKRKLTRATRLTHPERWMRFIEYCRLDIESMRAVFMALPRWNATPYERALQLVDTAINDRGMAIDLPLARGAIAVANRHRGELARRTCELTGGVVQSATQRDAFLKYLKDEYGLDLPKAAKAEIERRIAEPDLAEPVKELLRIRLSSTKISTEKFRSVMNATCADGRLRGCLQFRGAARTGRFSGRIFQPQNLARPTIKNDEINFAIEAVKDDSFEFFYEDPMRVLPNLLRGLIIAPKGRKLVVADYSNVEGRVLAWLAGEKWKLQAFRDFDAGLGHDLYKLTYARAFNVPPESVTKAQRQMGKVLELALGYGGGPGAFRTFAVAYGIDLHDMARAVKETVDPTLWNEAAEWYPKALAAGRVEDMDKVVFIACDAVKRAWRKANPAIVALWTKMGAAARTAIEEQTPERAGERIVADRRGAYLRLRLPSGRYLCYPSPRVDDDAVSYYGVGLNHKWDRIRSWGGKLVENATQAVACDLLCEALLRLEKEGYHTVLTVHDEAICETPDTAEYSVERMERIMCALPGWAEGLPLAAAGFEGYRYRKD